jgi:hypothetical protein
MSNFDHDRTAFKLTGHHRTVECKACHVNNVFKGTSQACVSCHAEPQAHKGKFGTGCASCHSTTTWATATLTVASLSNFDHDRTGFKLTGKHRTVECKSCHVNNVFKGTSQTCVSCHAEPQVHKGKFGTNCVLCHSTANWAATALAGANLANFDHDRTAFKLTGQHKMVACQDCHVNNTFKGTSQACVSCHAEPLVPTVHKVRYGTGCTRCHSTETWKKPTFDHSIFPVTHHNRRDGCAACHTDLAKFEVYSCTNCHEHTLAKEEQRHARRNVKIVGNLSDCIRCHARNRPRRAASLSPAEEMVQVCAGMGGGCPVAQDVADPLERLLALRKPSPMTTFEQSQPLWHGEKTVPQRGGREQIFSDSFSRTLLGPLVRR